MPTMLELKTSGGNLPQSSSNPQDQSSYSSSPTHHNAPSTGEEIVIVLGVLMVSIYGFKVLGRVIKREK